MGRSSKEEATRTRQRIVETASDLFRRQGVDHVSVAKLMAALGMTTGGFYKHFASKEALVAETIQLAFERSSSAWQDNAGHDMTDGRATRTGLVQYYLRPDPQNRCPMVAFADDAARNSSDIVSRAAYRDGAELLFRKLMEAADDSSQTKAPEQNAMVLFAAMLGARVLKDSAGNAEWVSAIREAVLDFATVSDKPV